MRFVTMVVASVLSALTISASPQQSGLPNASALDAMRRATAFMVEKVSTNGGYVWSYLPDLSRRWGEIEARPTMIWIQPQGTATMGHLFLDAYHATGDEYYYRAAARATDGIMKAQHSSGGWNYLHDFAGAKSLAEWYDTIGKNAWRLEEFQHDWGNATFDDAGTAESARLLLRMFAEKRDAAYKPALDRSIRFILDSQFPNGAWPQRFPKGKPFDKPGFPDYTGYITFNDDVAGENMAFLSQCYQVLGDERWLEPIARGMNAFVLMQQPAPHAGWGLQHSADMKPVAARTYEPRALTTHTTATNIELMLRFYRQTGDVKFLARIPEAIDWLEGLTLPPALAPSGRTHPTFVEPGTNQPIYVHREGSNVVNGRYYFNDNPRGTIGHYSAFRRIDVADLRRQYAAAKAVSPEEARQASPLARGAARVPLPRFFAVDMAVTDAPEKVIAALNTQGAWIGPLGTNSHPYKGPGSKTVTPGDFSTTHVGDDSDTSPFPDPKIVGISTATYIRNMSVLIRSVDRRPGDRAMGSGDRVIGDRVMGDRVVEWRIDSLDRIGGHAVTQIGAPRVVSTPVGPAVEFNGTSDGLMVDANPIEGLKAFTLEVQFQPAVDGPEEQRFVHVEEPGSANRALIELRLLAGRWALDTFLKSGDASLTLLDRKVTHPAGEWHVAALTYDGVRMTHYVNGERELAGPVAFKPVAGGRTSLGVRQNLVSYFKGRLRLVRVTPRALAPDQFLKRPIA